MHDYDERDVYLYHQRRAQPLASNSDKICRAYPRVFCALRIDRTARTWMGRLRRISILGFKAHRNSPGIEFFKFPSALYMLRQACRFHPLSRHACFVFVRRTRGWRILPLLAQCPAYGSIWPITYALADVVPCGSTNDEPCFYRFCDTFHSAIPKKRQ